MLQALHLAPVVAASAWCEATERQAAQRCHKLEAELTGYKTNLVKESIRMGHNDLGEFYYERGDLQVGDCLLTSLALPAVRQALGC